MKKLIFSFGVSLIFALASSVEASQVAGHSVSFVPEGLGGADALYVAPPNSVGYSINHLSQFDINAPVKLMNAPNYDRETGDPILPASTIVLIADKISITSSIDVVGPATDILLLSPSSNGDISCFGCVFNNVLRVTMASADPIVGINSNSVSVGTLRAQGAVNVVNLYAPGSISLSLIGKHVAAMGDIDINSAGVANGLGGFSDVAHGDYVLGTGSVEFAVGGLNWDYEERQVNQVFDEGVENTISANIYAPKVFISSSGDLNFTGIAETLTDALAVVSYKGQSHVPQEGVSLQALGASDTLTLRGQIFSDNVVNLRSAGDFYLESVANVKSQQLEILAGGHFINDSSLDAYNIAVAANRVFNEGEIVAKNQAQIWAMNDLANQYGGLIRAREVILESASLVVRNGSRTPYRSLVSETNNFLDISSSEILSSYFLSGGSNSSLYDSSELGSFYLVPSRVIVAQDAVDNVTPASKNSAHIQGESISIRAKAFENINPYYESVKNQSSLIDLSRQRIKQVSVSAENELQIQGARIEDSDAETFADYVVNSSALMTVNSPSGILRIKSQKVINNRYRVATFLTETNTSNTVAEDDLQPYITSEQTYTNSIGSATLVFSPPGFLVSMGSAEFQAPTYLANVLGYIEIFDGAKIYSPLLKNFGVRNQALSKTTTEVRTVYDRSNSSPHTTSSTIRVNPKDLDTLFHVRGALEASSTNAWVEMLNVYDYFVNQTLQYVENRTGYGNYTKTYNYGYCPCDYNNGTVYESSRVSSTLHGGTIYVDWSRYKKISSAYNDSFMYEYNEGGEKSFSLIEELRNFMNSVRQKLTDMINEFDWWGLAE